jgi:hypothetical protein
MTDNRIPEDRPQQKAGTSKQKKPYQKPAFRYERVFETAALSCGKVFGNVTACGQSRKTS